MVRKRLNRKGSLKDLLLVAIFLLFFGVILLIGFRVYSEIDAVFQVSSFTDANSRAASTAMLGHYTGVLDNTFLFMAIGFSLIVLVLASLVRIHPIFIPIFFMAWVFFIFIAGVLSNIYQGMAGDPNMIAYANQLTMITSILTFLPMIVGVFGAVLMVVMYKQWQIAQV